MSECSVCGGEFPEKELLRCHDCGKAYCPKCARKDPIIEALGICHDCEEVFTDEDDIEE
jgi:hypothetical protein